MNTVTETGFGPKRITGRMVLIGLLSFWAVVLIVNGIFIFMALDSWPGLATDRPYERGINYNRTLDAARAQTQLGWRSRLTYSARTLQFRLSTRNGVAISDATVRLTLKRPASAKFDQQITLTENDPGNYRAPPDDLAAGHWIGELEVVGRTGQRYRMIHELVVQP